MFYIDHASALHEALINGAQFSWLPEFTVYFNGSNWVKKGAR